MGRKIFVYTASLYAMYFFGHWGMSMVYGMGSSATTAMGAGLALAAVVCLWKAANLSEGKREIVWGVAAGFFIWCFFGEFLEHERIIALAEGQAAALLIPSLIIIYCAIYKKLLPLGIQFSLGHFGCVWLLHAILVHQVEVVKPLYPALFAVLLPATGTAFFLISIFMLFKTFRAGSEKAFMAYLLPFFIFLWAAVETLQAMDVLPDYTCYAYWNKRSAAGPGDGLLNDGVDNKAELLMRSYTWKDQEAERRAHALLTRFPSPRLIDDFTLRLERQIKGAGGKLMDEKVFYAAMEESFVTTAASAFEHLLKEEIERFRATPWPKGNRRTGPATYSGSDPLAETVAEKTAFIIEHYPWENPQTRDLAGHLLSRFAIQFLTGDTFIRRLDDTVAQQEKTALSEEMLCRVMQEDFTATSRAVFRNLIKTPVE